MTTTLTATTASGLGVHGRSGPQHDVNWRLAVALMALVVLAPLPLGSNRPIFWAISATLLAVMGVVYGLSLWRRQQSLRYPLARIRWIGAAFTVLCVFLFIQTLPIAGLLDLGRFTTFNGVSIFSPTLSLTPDATWLMLMRMLGYGLFFFLVLQVAVNRGRAQFLLNSVFYAIVFYAAYSLLALSQLGDTLIGMDKWAYLGSATGTFVNRNSFATFLAFGLAIGASLIVGLLDRGGDDGRGRRSILGTRGVATIAGMIFIGAALLASQSRMGLFAGIAASAFVFALGAGRSGLRRAGWIALLAIASIGAAFVLVLYGNGVLERVGSLQSSGDVRGALYQQVLNMIETRPWLGFGGGSFELAFPLFHHAPVSADVVWDKAHSTYLTLWTELGVIAGSIPMVIVGAVTRRNLISAWHDDGNRVLALAAVGVATVGAIHSTVDFSLEIQANAYCFLAVLALGFASERSSSKAKAAVT